MGRSTSSRRRPTTCAFAVAAAVEKVGIESATVGHPAAARVLTALFKDRFQHAAERVGFPMPATAAPTNTAEALAAGKEVGYPVVLKPRSHAGVGLRRGAVVQHPRRAGVDVPPVADPTGQRQRARRRSRRGAAARAALLRAGDCRRRQRDGLPRPRRRAGCGGLRPQGLAVAAPARCGDDVRTGAHAAVRRRCRRPRPIDPGHRNLRARGARRTSDRGARRPRSQPARVRPDEPRHRARQRPPAALVQRRRRHRAAQLHPSPAPRPAAGTTPSGPTSASPCASCGARAASASPATHGVASSLPPSGRCTTGAIRCPASDS